MIYGVPILILLIVFTFWLWNWLETKARVSDRLNAEGELESVGRASSELMPQEFVSAWLYRAGYRSSLAVWIFWGATIICSLIGLVIIYQLWRLGTFQLVADTIGSIPGGVGNVMVPFILATPWFLLVVLTLVPTLIVRSVRRNRVKSIEQDLPLMLDLLNTLAQAGIGFDSALDQILSVQKPTRPLVQEMRIFQSDNLAGRSRVDALRQLMQRVQVPMFSTFVSAIVQAEQTGAGMGATLRTQSSEMRSRRREKAAAAALSVPTLLVVPMVVGFLPGIFVILLGPMLFEAFGVMEQSFRGVLGQ